MRTVSLLPYHFAAPGVVQDEDEWIEQQFNCLDGRVAQGQFVQASEICERLLGDFEGHFAFEETVMARIDFPWAPGHCADHTDVLVALATLLREIREVAASFSQPASRGTQLQSRLSDIARHAHLHVAREDSRLQRFAARIAGIPDR